MKRKFYCNVLWVRQTQCLKCSSGCATSSWRRNCQTGLAQIRTRAYSNNCVTGKISVQIYNANLPSGDFSWACLSWNATLFIVFLKYAMKGGAFRLRHSFELFESNSPKALFRSSDCLLRSGVAAGFMLLPPAGVFPVCPAVLRR